MLIMSAKTVACTVLAIALPLAGVTGEYQKAEVVILLGGAALYAFLSINVLWNVEQIFKSIRVNQTSFSTQVTHYLKKTAVAIMIIAIVPALIGSILIQAIVPESVVRFDFQYVTLVIGLVLLMLGHVFNYGIELQNKDDETL